MQTAQRLKAIKPSATLAINARALELKESGIAVTSLAVGEPDFPTPAHICTAAKAAIDAGFTRYTAVPGIVELRCAVAEYFNSTYGIHAEAKHTIIGNGGKQMLYDLFQALLNPGDEVLVPAPYWVSYPEMILLAEGVPIPVAASSERGFKVNPDDLEAHYSPKTRILILNSPSNPTGACYTATEMDALMEWALKRGLFVISDEIYDQLVYAPARAVSAAGWWERYPEQVAVVNGLSKSFAMTGWRVGYTLAHPALIKALSTLQGQATSSICSIAQKAALAALTGGLDCVAAMRASFQERRNLAWGIVSSWPDVVCPKPDGAFYLFADIHRLYSPKMPDSAAACTHILDTARVALVPGAAFGDDACIRFSYAASPAVLRDALSRVQHALYA